MKKLKIENGYGERKTLCGVSENRKKSGGGAKICEERRNRVEKIRGIPLSVMKKKKCGK